MWSRFLEYSGSTEVGRSLSPLSYWQNLIASDNAYDGDLTFSLFPGLDITIPNHQLITPEYDFDIEGQIYIKNDTRLLTQLHSLEDVMKNWMPSLGSGFFSSAYLMVDNDRSEFTLWKGQPSKDQAIMPISNRASSCNASPAAPTVGSTTATSESEKSTPGSAKPSAGMIAGATVGGLAALAAIVAVTLLCARRRDKPKEELLNTNNSSGAEYGKPELPDDQDHHPPSEMPLSSDPSCVLEPYEVSDNNAAHELPVAWMNELPATPEK